MKPQLACFERLGAPGWGALAEVIAAAARDAGLLVVADGKRGDVPVTAAAYGQALVGETQTPWGAVRGLGADAFTANPLLGGDALDPLVDAAAAGGRRRLPAGPDLEPGRGRHPGRRPRRHPAARAPGGAGRRARPPGSPARAGCSGMGAVVGATAPEHLARLRELMPDSIFLIPGVGAQGGRVEDLGAALAPGRPASILVAAARSIAGADDPGAAAEQLRAALWEVAHDG